MFLDIVKTPQQDYPNSDLFCFYGYKFETICTAEDDRAVVDSTSEFALMLRLKLGSHSVLMAAEVDCQARASPYDSSGSEVLDPGSFMEMKTVK